ncbi:MAG: FAD-binding oxidoreductase [Chloroflexi bacterium HGW-Chloroflexi-8]|jgi:alkyldihydroxyacetonephosphate synthase|nr:MAG: FAD-binding oxidoreductase [Chloroflexi bacterium HGW-Chloroflexi-8]
MKQDKTILPPWTEESPKPDSFRSLFKWGNLSGFKHPNKGMVALLKEVFQLDEADLTHPRNSGFEKFDIEIPSKIPAEHQRAFEEIVGSENIQTDTYSRTQVSYGHGMIDALRLRNHIVENIPDLVISPRSDEDIECILVYCDQNRIPINIFGAGSTVTRGTEAKNGGISLNLSKHMNKVLAFCETNQTITVQPGMTGPQLEEILNHAPQTLNARMRYTCGHFPQSFMHSSVGGWVVTRGAGQNSTYYGKIEDLVLQQTYITPRGKLTTPGYARCATGPDFNQIMIGSEGCFGVLTAVTLKLHRYNPENITRFSYLFHNWEDAQAAVREIMQSEFGFPSVLRLSDPEESDVAMRMYHIHGSPADSVLKAMNYLPMLRCLLIGSCDGQHSFTRLVNRKIRQIAARYHAFPLTPFQVTQRWEKTRFTDPYMREDLMDFGILIDTLECAVTWDQLSEVHQKVRSFVKSRPQTICMTHLSHSYPQGTNLYFIFIAHMTDINEYLKLQYGVLQAIQESGAAMSHHHGIGKQTGPWLEGQIGKANMDVLRTLKKHFDPNNIMNPGGTLGLDLDQEQKEKRWGMR